MPRSRLSPEKRIDYAPQFKLGSREFNRLLRILGFGSGDDRADTLRSEVECIVKEHRYRIAAAKAQGGVTPGALRTEIAPALKVERRLKEAIYRLDKRAFDALIASGWQPHMCEMLFRFDGQLAHMSTRGSRAAIAANDLFLLYHRLKARTSQTTRRTSVVSKDVRDFIVTVFEAAGIDGYPNPKTQLAAFNKLIWFRRTAK